MALRVGVLGGICSAKSTLLEMMLINPGVWGIDMDTVAKRAIYTEENKGAIVEIFSKDALSADGTYNFAHIRKEFFGNKETYDIASRVYKPIIEKARKRVFQEIPPSTKIVLVESATLHKKSEQENLGLEAFVVVFCDSETQIKRAMKRNGHTRDQVLSIMSNQAPPSEFLQLKNAIHVDSNVDLATFQEIAKATYHKLLLQASSV